MDTGTHVERISIFSWFELAEGVQTAMFIGTGLLALLALLPGLDFGSFKIPDLPSKLRGHRRFLLFIPLCIAIVIVVPWIPVRSPTTDTSWFSFEPIKNVEKLSKSFSIQADPPPQLKLWFQTQNWPIRFRFSVSATVTIGELKNALLSHFQIKEHVRVDYSKYPPGNGVWETQFQLTVNGTVVSDIESSAPTSYHNTNNDTLASANLRNGDVLSITVDTRWWANLVRRTDDEYPEPPPAPPPIRL